eukprot:TRINITY_DN34530_c0_g1_i1.p1 TRINITY_DN34530_c0_g1~~TRINITY_DN34530_c0_g1_i1.p1  ORF type:complete len:461 (-),score=97.52 TRINITY_DN34530_c0_g1_i1:74-1456(-)
MTGERRARLCGVSPLARASKRSKPDDVAKILKDADANGDGVLSLEELKSYLGDYLGFGDAEIQAFFKEYGQDGKGVDQEGLQKGFASLNPYLVSKRKEEVIIRKPGSVNAPGGQVSIEDLSDCTVLICDRSEQAFVDECKNCKVLIGPCDSSTFVRDCVGCTFWIATRQLRTRNCKDCKFFLHAHTEPIIESSEELSFAPFSASYPGLSRHFEEAKFNAGKNMWKAIFDFSGKPDKANWRITPLSDCEELLVELPGEQQDDSSAKSWDCPSAPLSHDLLCANPPPSDDSGNSVANIPQTKPALPAEPPAGTAAQRTTLCDGPKKASEKAKTGSAKEQKPIKLKKPKFINVARITPEMKGVNIYGKVVKATPVEGMTDVSDVVVGDASAVVTVRARGSAEVAACEVGKIVRVQNAFAVVKNPGHICIEITKWGVLKPAPDHEDVEPNVSKDISAVQYERAK